MMELLKFVLSDLWIFIGFTIIFSIPFYAIVTVCQLLLRHSTMRKQGYPPRHCDADGDQI